MLIYKDQGGKNMVSIDKGGEMNKYLIIRRKITQRGSLWAIANKGEKFIFLKNKC